MTIAYGIKFSPVNIEERQRLDFRAGDNLRVWQRIKEGDPSRKGRAEADKTRLQAFEGLVIARKHGSEPGATFTIRKVVEGIGVERIFPLYSPTIEKIELVSRSKTRRAKLYYIREKAAREIRKKMKQLKMVEKTMLEKTEEKTAEEKLPETKKE